MIFDLFPVVSSACQRARNKRRRPSAPHSRKEQTARRLEAVSLWRPSITIGAGWPAGGTRLVGARRRAAWSLVAGGRLAWRRPRAARSCNRMCTVARLQLETGRELRPAGSPTRRPPRPTGRGFAAEMRRASLEGRAQLDRRRQWLLKIEICVVIVAALCMCCQQHLRARSVLLSAGKRV